MKHVGWNCCLKGDFPYFRPKLHADEKIDSTYCIFVSAFFRGSSKPVYDGKSSRVSSQALCKISASLSVTIKPHSSPGRIFWSIPQDEKDANPDINKNTGYWFFLMSSKSNRSLLLFDYVYSWLVYQYSCLGK